MGLKDAEVFSCMQGPLRTFADVCGPVWTFADVCGRLRTFADVCGPVWTFADDVLIPDLDLATHYGGTKVTELQPEVVHLLVREPGLNS